MKNFKKLIVVGAVVLALGATSITALAASGSGTPAEIVAGLTGQSVESVISERAQSGETYGAIADEAGVLEQFKAQMIEQKKAALAERVAAGTMTQERADEIIAAMEENQANCDGTCSGGTGAGMGTGFGGMSGNHSGGRYGSGNGLGTCTR
ncbi:MAG: DUF2680 domain-containing protein [Oscillospiraceae bacterium]